MIIMAFGQKYYDTKIQNGMSHEYILVVGNTKFTKITNNT